MYYVYVIWNAKGKLYKGFTEDIDKRLKQHNEGQLKGYTKNKGPWELVHLEKFESEAEARQREKFFKSGHGRDYLDRILRQGT